MSSFKLKQVFLTPFYRDLLIVLPFIFFILNFSEVLYDLNDEAVNLFFLKETYEYFGFSIFLATPFFIFRYFLIKKSDYKKNKIFISYQTNDQALVEKIKKILDRDRELFTWWQKDILPGQDYTKEIEKNINESDVVLIMYSNNYEKSEPIQNWELPFIKKEKKIRPELLLTTCIVGDYEKEVPFSTEYQIVQSRSTGFHRMLSKEFKLAVNNLRKVLNIQLVSRSLKNTQYTDLPIFKIVYSLFFGFFIYASLSYLISGNSIDNSIDKAINYPNEIFEIDDQHLIFKEYADLENFYDFALRDNFELDVNKSYFKLVEDFTRKPELLKYEQEWQNLIDSAYEVKIYYINYLYSHDPWNSDIYNSEVERGNWVNSLENYNKELCNLLKIYINNEGYSFNLSKVWSEEQFNNFCA